jgi:pSer/pThr/pTyr-binding forkhead associated (FHA) protein
MHYQQTTRKGFIMIFKQTTTETPATKQLFLNNTNIAPADERHHIPYANGMPDQLIFNSLSNPEHMLTFDLNSIMVIGRKRSMRDYEVNIDLADLNGAELGVSRYHAMLLALDNHIYIKDIESMNGMRLNGKQMTPSKEYIIDIGDIIAFGNLEVKIQFIYQ